MKGGHATVRLLRSFADVKQLLERRVNYEKNRGRENSKILNLEPI